MKKIFSIIIVLASFLFIDYVKANSISRIDMDIYVDNYGTAHIKESWTATLNSGTEGYKPYYNLGNSTIKNFKVTETLNDSLVEYEDKINWNVDASFDEKAYKSGLHNINNGVELCFGISKYGTHTYVMTYDITNFVAKTDDSQIIYWTLIPYELSSKPDNVYIKIHSDFNYSDDLPVWGYGNYGGLAYVYDGYIELSKEYLDSDEYMTVLVKFPQDTFQVDNYIGNDFEHYYNMAENGATHYNKDKEDFLGIVITIASMLFQILFWVFIVYAISKSSTENGLKSGSYTLDFGQKGRKLPKEVNMFRDIPCNKDIYRAYFIAYNYKLMKKQTDFLGVILLKWLKEKKIKIESKTVGTIFKKEDTVIIFEQNSSFENAIEADLFRYMYEASIDGILESREFEKWCSTHYKKILDWFNKVLDYENKILEEEGKLVKEEVVSFKVFKSIKYTVDESLYDEAVQMKGLKTFFEEFKNMEDKKAIEVSLWEEYLMYAQLFGIAKEVAKEFKKIYPDVITDYSYESVIFIQNISYSGMSSANTAKSRAESYSSGGGGFSSGGGGGGSFGGGGGGGGFR